MKSCISIGGVAVPYARHEAFLGIVRVELDPEWRDFINQAVPGREVTVFNSSGDQFEARVASSDWGGLSITVELK